MVIWVIVAIIIVAAVAGGLIYYQGVARPSVQGNDGNIVGDNSNTVADDTQSGTLRSLLASGQPQTCTFSLDQSDGSVVNGTGQLYVDNGKMRGDFKINSNGQTMTAHTVVMDNAVYSWIDGMGTGNKMAMSADSSATDNNQAVKDSSGLDQNVNYKCQPAAADDSKFDLPVNVKFNEIVAGQVTNTDGANTAPSGQPTPAKVDCTICDQAPDNQRAACLAALGC